MPIKRRPVNFSPSAHALMKLLISGLYYYEKSKKPESVANFKHWLPEALIFVKYFHLDKAALERVVKLVAAGAPHAKLDDPMIDVGESMKENWESISKDNSLSKDEITLLKALARWHTTGAEASVAMVARLVSILKDPDLNKLFTVRKTSKTKSVNALRDLVKSLTGRDSLTITMEEKQKISADDWRKYYDLRKVLKQGFEQTLQSLFRSSGKDLLDVDTVRKAFIDAGLPQKVAVGFEGMMDESGRYYTSKGDLLSLKGVAPGSKIIMNKDYKQLKSDPGKETYVLKIVPKDKSESDANRIYTDAHNSARREGKEQKVADLTPVINKIVSKFQKGLSSTDPRTKVISTILELSWITSFRIGNPGNATAGEETFGVSTLKKKNVSFKGLTVTLDFKGKSGVPHKKTLKSTGDRFLAQAISNLKELWDITPEGEHIFRVDGNLIKVTEVNSYLKTLYEGLTVKVFRTLQGTQLAIKIIDSCPLQAKDTTQSEAEKWYKEHVGMKVGELLNHRKGVTNVSEGQITPSTSIKNYISKSVSENFFKNLGLRVPEFIRGIK